jgi:hypothetical protein
VPQVTLADLGLGVLVFYFTALEENIAVRRTRAMMGRDAVAAGMWCAIFAGIILVSLASLLHNGWLFIPYILGSGLGGWHAVKHANKEPTNG